jgi:hypothetical protein
MYDMTADNIPNTFTTADELFAWLRSPAGGSLMVRETEDSPYAIIYYDKKKSNMALPHVQMSRSVVWDKVNNKPVCSAPAHGRKFGQAVDDKLENFIVEEFIDGVMINMFYDPLTAQWRLATRTQLDATGRFFSARSFAEHFWETFAERGYKVEDLDKASYYSWVLQHPAERIVVSPMYGIATLTLVASSSPVSDLLNVVRPIRYTLKTLEDVKEFVDTNGRREGTRWQGVVVKPLEGSSTPWAIRYKLRSNEYDEARHLRGNQAKRAYIWLERWEQGSLSAYLRNYPEEQCDANSVINAFKAATQELHDLYMKVYRQKSLPLGKAPQKYRKLLWDAHKANVGAYFPHLRTFMNEQDTARKLWVVNYDTRYGSSSSE